MSRARRYGSTVRRDATVTLTGTELKVEMVRPVIWDWATVFVRMRQDDGSVTYRYLVLRIKEGDRRGKPQGNRRHHDLHRWCGGQSCPRAE